MEFNMVDGAIKGTNIKVVGVGGAGGNAVEHMIRQKVSGVEFIAINTDAQALENSSAETILQLGNSGLGAGTRPDIGRQLAEEAREKIADVLQGAHMVFIAAGMGGGTGTGASPVIAQIAKEMGALTVAVVSKPFSYEGTKCMRVAEEGINELTKNVDSVIVILNEKLEEMYEDASIREWFEHADDVLKNAVAGIAEVINESGHMNVDFNDVKTIMQEQGKAMMGMATASGVDRARLAAEQAIDSPLLDGESISGARAVLINVSGSDSIKGKEIKEVNDIVRGLANKDAIVISGLIRDDSLGDDLRVTVIATGINADEQKKPVLVPSEQPVLKTGTDDVVAISQNTVRSNTEQSAQGMTNRPSVWRKPAVSETVPKTKSAVLNLDDLLKGDNNIDDFNIPAFIRKQAD